ncbi:MAG TPA: hypothetical protein VEY93_16665 [Longimicrobium sp.]|nr:hypothetical protein [Longimicrobium sp.]
MAPLGMAARRPFACAALVVLALAGCSDVLSNVEPPKDGESSETGPRGMGPFQGADGEAPARAMAASTDCPNRCALPMNTRPNMPAGAAQLFQVDEVARLLGNGSAAAPFSWRNSAGAVELRIPPGYTSRMAGG